MAVTGIYIYFFSAIHKYSHLCPIKCGLADVFHVSGKELIRRAGPPEYMKVTNLAKLLNRDRKFINLWLSKIVEHVKSEIPEKTYDAGAHRQNRYSYFTNLCEGEAIKLAMDFGRILVDCEKPRRGPETAEMTLKELAMSFSNYYLEDRDGDFAKVTRYFGPLAVGYIMQAFGDYVQSIDDLNPFGVSSSTDDPKTDTPVQPVPTPKPGTSTTNPADFLPATQEVRERLKTRMNLPDDLTERVLDFQRRLGTRNIGAPTSTISVNPYRETEVEESEVKKAAKRSKKGRKKVSRLIS